jgi:hypothetical protein
MRPSYKTYRLNLSRVDTHDYLLNPVVCADFDYSRLPIGRAIIRGDKVTVEFVEGVPEYPTALLPAVTVEDDSTMKLTALSVVTRKKKLNIRRHFRNGLRDHIPLCCVIRFSFTDQNRPQAVERGVHNRGFVPCLVFHRPSQS